MEKEKLLDVHIKFEKKQLKKIHNEIIRLKKIENKKETRSSLIRRLVDELL